MATNVVSEAEAVVASEVNEEALVVVMDDLRRRTCSTRYTLCGILIGIGDAGSLHPVASGIYTFQEAVAVAEDVGIGLVNAADLLSQGALGRLYAGVRVLLLQADQGALHDAPAEHLLLTAPDPQSAAPVAPPQLGRGRGLPRADLGLEAVSGPGPQAMTAEGCPGRTLDLVRRWTSQAHHHSGCHDPVLEARHAVDEVFLNHDRPTHGHGLSPHHMREGREDADVLFLLKTLNHELM